MGTDDALLAELERLRAEFGPGWVAIGSRPGLGFYRVVDDQPVPISDDVGVPTRFEIKQGPARLEVDYESGQPRVTLHLDGLDTGALQRFQLHRLLELVTNYLTVTLTRRPLVDAMKEEFEGFVRDEYIERMVVELGREYLEPGEGVFTPAARQAVRRSQRSRITDDNLRTAADAYRKGGIEAVKGALFLQDRQAWRYVARAQELGYVDRVRARPAKKGKKK
jgi:hypothetical protein